MIVAESVGGFGEDPPATALTLPTRLGASSSPRNSVPGQGNLRQCSHAQYSTILGTRAYRGALAHYRLGISAESLVSVGGVHPIRRGSDFQSTHRPVPRVFTRARDWSVLPRPPDLGENHNRWLRF